MEYKRFGDQIVLRLDPGEELISTLAAVCEKENVLLGSVTGLGAAGEVELGIFEPAEKKYYKTEYRGSYEIASLVGNVTRQEGAVYLHLHATIGNPSTGECHGGHLSRAVVSATSEIFVHTIPGAIGRKLSDRIGLNLLDF